MTKFPWYLLYGHYARPPDMESLGTWNWAINGCIIANFLLWLTTMIWLTRTFVSSGYWKRFSGAKHLHDTPRTVWLWFKNFTPGIVAVISNDGRCNP